MLVTAYDQRTGRAYQVRPEAVGHPLVGPDLALTPPTRVESKTSGAKRASRKTTRRRPVVAEVPSAAPQTETPAIGEKE